jgi:hypothetical protein
MINININYVKVKDCRVKFCNIGDLLIVCFPGTGAATGSFLQSVKSWALDFMAARVPYKQMSSEFKAHAGFLNIYKDAEKYIKSQIIGHNCKKILFTGYSQGGAIAMLAYEDYAYQGYNVAGITFAQPRVFTPGAPAERFDNLTRVNVRGDIVTTVPYIRFKHYGKSMPIGKKYNALFPTVKNHYPDVYKKYLKGLFVNV